MKDRMRDLIIVKRKNFLRVLVALLTYSFTLPISVEAEIWNQTIKADLFLELRDFREPRPGEKFHFVLDTETNEVDISDFVQIISRAKNSKYNNFPIIDSTLKDQIATNYLSHLCEKLSTKPSECKDKVLKKLRQTIYSLGQELLQDIRYPYDYYLIDTKEGNEALSEARDTLTSQCPDCSKIYLDYGSEKEFNSLFSLMEKQKHSCLEKIIENMAERLKYYRVPDSCEKNKNHPLCESMSENYRLFHDRFLRLTELVYGKSARSQTEARLCINCRNFSDQEKAKSIDPKSLEGAWEQARNCEELQSGQQKRVSSGTGRGVEYPIRREDDGNYTAVLNLQFVAADDYEGDVTKSQVPLLYKERVQKCLKEKAGPKLLGPNGEKLQIVLEEKTFGSCPEPATVIEISKPKIFSIENKYASDIRCSTITHEVLHKLGLCDDYSNETRGYIIDSKTGKPVKVVDPDTGEWTTEVGDVEAVEPASGQEVVLKYDCRVTRSNSIMEYQRKKWNNVFRRKTEKSLITPEQWSAILYGDCKEKNQLFNECSQLAYKTSFEDPTCLEKKRKCEAQNALGSP